MADLVTILAFAGTILAIALFGIPKMCAKKRKPGKKDVVSLHQFPTHQLQVWMKMAKIPYVVPKRFDSASPKGKYPFVRINNETIGDSTLIIGRLKTIFKSSLDEKLTPKELAVSRAFQRLAEEHLYWADVYFRWIPLKTFNVYKKYLFFFLPACVRPVVAFFARRAVKKSLHAHGLGRHSPEEIAEFGKQDIHDISVYLGEKPYFMGKCATTIDATIFGAISGFVYCHYESPLCDYVRALPNLKAYVDRMIEEFFPELVEKLPKE